MTVGSAWAAWRSVFRPAMLLLEAYFAAAAASICCHFIIAAPQR